MEWGQLAIRAVRHLGHREAVLRSDGEGPDGEQGIGSAQGYTRHLGRRLPEGLVRRPLRADAARCLVTRRAAKSAP
jgi:hypothetical protein